jgi:uncharacterized protein (UPF0332 family)
MSTDQTNQPAWENTFRQVMDLWVTPEVERRQAAGAIPKPFNLHAAQVIFYADGRPHEIRLNEEVRAIGKVKLKQGVAKQEGDPIYSNEIEGYEAFRLPDDEDPNCGHITLHRFADQWSLAFDLIYNKGISSEHLAAAEEFLKSAEAALERGHYRVVVDNLFSASELAAKAVLLTTPLPGEGTKMGHGRIHSRFNLQARLGNVSAGHRDAFNQLSHLRSSARYLSRPLTISEVEVTELLAAVRDAIGFARSRVTTYKD